MKVRDDLHENTFLSMQLDNSSISNAYNQYYQAFPETHDSHQSIIIYYYL